VSPPISPSIKDSDELSMVDQIIFTNGCAKWKIEIVTAYLSMNLNTERERLSIERNGCLCVGLDVNGKSGTKGRHTESAQQKKVHKAGKSRDRGSRQEPRAAYVDRIIMIPPAGYQACAWPKPPGI